MQQASTLSEEVRVKPLVRFFTLLWLRLKKPFLARRIRRPALEWVGDAPLLVLPEVLNPVVFRSGEFLARVVSEFRLDESASRPRVLDMGCGSGVAAIFAARRGSQVVAVDINPEAIRCTRVNVLLNHLEDRVETRQGDLFGAIKPEERFDLVLFNPPFFRGRPRDWFDTAWRGVDVMERFAEGLAGVLRPGGTALVLLSTDGDAAGMLAALKAAGMRTRPEARHDFGNEVMTVYRCSPAEVEEASSR